MNAYWIAGRREKRKLGREDENRLVATGHGFLKLDGTDDDADDEVAQNKLLVLVVNDVKLELCAASCLREKGASEYATNGVAESVMHAVKRKNRVLKFALETHLIFAARML